MKINYWKVKFRIKSKYTFGQMLKTRGLKKNLKIERYWDKLKELKRNQLKEN